MTVPTDTPSTDGAPEPEEVLMAADPTLADRIKRAEADLDQLHSDLHDQECLMPLQDQWLTEARTVMEAAAVRLRKLDAIEEAVGDPDQLRAIARFGLARRSHTDGHAYLRRIADALGGTE